MQLFDPNNPNEKKKLIAAAVLGVGAIAVLGYVFFGGSSKKAVSNNPIVKVAPTPTKIVKDPDSPPDDSSFYQPVVYPNAVAPASEANRNIFAYYEPTPKPPPPINIPTPTPTPTPPVIITSLAPSNVYARTADFSLQITGDKFTPAVHITIDGRDLPTHFVNSQQLVTTVPATLIANPGVRQVIARSNDGQLYSNAIMLNVTPPPTPNYTYIGIIGKPRFNDTAVLQDKSSKELVKVQRGDLLGGRFRVSSISEKEIVVFDTTLKIKHTLGFTVDASTTNPQFRPPVRVSDEEPQ